MRVKRALISVSDKSGIVEFAKGLASLGVKILSTGGTARALREAGVEVEEVSTYTDFPEILQGRVKSLHPKIHGGILAKRNEESHMEELASLGIEPIDMVVVNLYPFEETIAREGVSLDEVLENIDIGGPSLLRSAAKNYRDVIVIVNPARYTEVLEQLKLSGDIPLSLRQELALEVFRHTAHYDSAIAEYFEKLWEHKKFPHILKITYEKVAELRYGENPHQEGAFYKEPVIKEPCLATARQLSGKELSYNNIMDLDAALALVKEFDEPAAAIIKHTNPCGAATASTLAQAYKDALECDPLSAFGCIIALNRTVDMETARLIHETHFVEACIAPGYESEALQLLCKKKNRRFLEVEDFSKRRDIPYLSIRQVVGGLLVQDSDSQDVTPSTLKVVTNRAPNDEELASLLFAWKVCKHVKSNSVVFAKGTKTVGIGAGQMSRVDSVIIAARKAGERAKGAVMASEALLPKADNVEVAAEAGIVAIIQPGGAKEDEAVIEACNKYGIAMVFTGMRHFKH